MKRLCRHALCALILALAVPASVPAKAAPDVAGSAARPQVAEPSPRPQAETGRKKAYEVDRTAWMKGQWGVMTHYLLTWQARDHKLTLSAQQWNAMVDAFDVDGLAEQIGSTGARYHLLTIGQQTSHLLTPCPLFDELLAPKPDALNPDVTSNCSRRDLVADMAAALAKRGIRQMVYATAGPPRDSREVGGAAANPPGDYRNKERMVAWERVLEEWSLRWGDKVSGWWFDGVYTPNQRFNYPDAPNFQSFAAAARAGNPLAAVTFNRGVMDRPISITPYEDYTGGEINDIETARLWRIEDGKVDGARLHLLSYLGQKWGEGEPRYEDLTQLVIPRTLDVLEIGGAVTWDVPVQPSGLIAGNYLAQLRAIGKAIARAPKGDPAKLKEDRIRDTEARLEAIVRALAAIKADIGRYPTTEEGLDLLLQQPPCAKVKGWKGPYLEEPPKDTFGSRYSYVGPSKPAAPYELASPGPDRELRTRDDIPAKPAS